MAKDIRIKHGVVAVTFISSVLLLIAVDVTMRKSGFYFASLAIRDLRSEKISSRQKPRLAPVPYRRMPNVVRHNTTDQIPFLCLPTKGRLGNQMFQYAALYAMAKKKNMIPLIERNSSMYSVFKELSANPIVGKLCVNATEVTNVRDCAYDEGSEDFTSVSSGDVTMKGYYQSWRYFEDYQEEIRKEFTFKETIMSKAKATLNHALERRFSSNMPENITFVGLHIRRGDYNEDYYIQYGYTVAGEEYIYRAMHYFTSRFENVLFIVCSNDRAWAKHILPINSRVIVINGESAPVDMAVLTLCDHNIITLGTYGWWSAWLSKGDITVYYKHQFVEGTKLAEQFSPGLEDFMYPGWIGLG